MSEKANAAAVLLLEDDWDHRTVFRRFLEHRGWSVREAAEAATARALLDAGPVDVVVLDLGGTNGWALLEEIGRHDGRPRVLCLTGDVRVESRERAVALGADAFLTKPVPLGTLCATLDRLTGLLPRPVPAPVAAPVDAPVDAPAARPGGTSAAAEPATGTAAAGSSAATARAVPRPVVLLLEDDDDARAIYRDMLDFAGYEVIAAADGAEGLRYAEARVPDVVVTDLHMPGMNGVDVARTFREEIPACPAIIAVTADSLGVQAGRTPGDGPPLFDEVLVKPVSPGELVRTVRAYVPPGGDAR